MMHTPVISRASATTLLPIAADGAAAGLATFLAVSALEHVHGLQSFNELSWALYFGLMVPCISALLGVYREGIERQSAAQKLKRCVISCVIACIVVFLITCSAADAISTRSAAATDLVNSANLMALAMVSLAGSMAAIGLVRSGLLWAWHFVRRSQQQALALNSAIDPSSQSLASTAARALANVFTHRVLIIGECSPASAAMALAHELASHPRHVRHGLVLAGVHPGYGLAQASAPGEDSLVQTFCPTLALSEVVEAHQVSQIVVALSDRRSANSARLMNELLTQRLRGVEVFELATYHELINGEIRLDSLTASHLVYANGHGSVAGFGGGFGQGFGQGFVRSFFKRCFDIVTSSLLLVLTSPLMLIAALAIRLESPGAVIYRQERVGLGGKNFTCLKLRSMRSDAEGEGKPMWAVKGDPRITLVGRVIRKTRIDELPQLLSVLKGEMSMVGPRPERPAFVAELRQTIPFYDVRHSVKPGITGWSQVRHGYSDSAEGAARKHQFDLYYVKNHSLLLDIVILMETVSVVLFREGAH